jgi:hypothetical protein
MPKTLPRRGEGSGPILQIAQFLLILVKADPLCMAI